MLDVTSLKVGGLYRVHELGWPSSEKFCFSLLKEENHSFIAQMPNNSIIIFLGYERRYNAHFFKCIYKGQVGLLYYSFALGCLQLTELT